MDKLKILFFSYLLYDNNYSGGNWVNSLINLLAKRSKYDIGLVYVTYDSSHCKEIHSSIKYYPLYRKKSFISKIMKRFFREPDFIRMDDEVNRIINDFNPDIVQLFGIETAFGGIAKSIKNVPVIVHLQGFSTVCKEHWFPMGLSFKMVRNFSSFREKITFLTASDSYLRFQKLANVEVENFKNYFYYLGRTEWDYQISRLLSPQSKYFLCNEVLRDEFYASQWGFHKTNKIILSTILNGEIYKGFDVILRSAILLKKLDLNFEWNIYGVSENFSLRRVIEKYLNAKFDENNVSFCGKKNAGQLAENLLSSTFYIHPTHIDNSPNALCEAMLLGVPCIATYVGGIPSLIENGVSGILVPDSEAFQIAYWVNKLWDDEERLKRLGKNAHVIASKRHDVGEILSTLDRIYMDVKEEFLSQKK